MTDVFTKAKRSEVMSRIHSRGNKDTELVLVRWLREHKITGWRRHQSIRARAVLLRGPKRGGIVAPPYRGRPQGPARQSVPTFRVRPDFIFPKVRLAVFVDGCFWHGCPRHATKPKSNRAFWRNKLARNQARDRLVNRTLRRLGWQVVRIWECRLQKNPLKCVQRIQRALVFADGHCHQRRRCCAALVWTRLQLCPACV